MKKAIIYLSLEEWVACQAAMNQGRAMQKERAGADTWDKGAVGETGKS